MLVAVRGILHQHARVEGGFEFLIVFHVKRPPFHDLDYYLSLLKGAHAKVKDEWETVIDQGGGHADYSVLQIYFTCKYCQQNCKKVINLSSRGTLPHMWSTLLSL